MITDRRLFWIYICGRPEVLAVQVLSSPASVHRLEDPNFGEGSLIYIWAAYVCLSCLYIRIVVNKLPHRAVFSCCFSQPNNSSVHVTVFPYNGLCSVAPAASPYTTNRLSEGKNATVHGIPAHAGITKNQRTWEMCSL